MKNMLVLILLFLTIPVAAQSLLQHPFDDQIQEYKTFAGNQKSLLPNFDTRGFIQSDTSNGFKTNNKEQYQLDSIVFEELDTISHLYVPQRYESYKYDSEQRTIKIYQYFIASEGKTYINTYTYNDDNTIMEIRVDIWEERTQSLLHEYKYQYDYVNNGKVKKIFLLQWNKQTNNWSLVSKKQYDYDANGFIAFCFGYKLDDNKVWAVYNVLQYNCDTRGNILSEAEYGWFESYNNWLAIEKNEYTYNESNRKTSHTRLGCYDTTYIWTNKYKEEYSYNEKGKQIMHTSFTWVHRQNAWLNYQKTEQTYNDKNVYTTNYDWDITNNQWKIVGQYKLIYDIANAQIHYTQSNKDSVGNWVDLYKETWNIDTAVSNSDILFPSTVFFISQLRNILYKTDTVYSGYLTGIKYNNRKRFIYSKHQTTGSSDLSVSTIYLYPNPANDVLYIKTPALAFDASFIVTNTLGKCVQKSTILNNQVSVSNLSNGMYFYTIEHRNKLLHSGKLIIQH